MLSRKCTVRGSCEVPIIVQIGVLLARAMRDAGVLNLNDEDYVRGPRPHAECVANVNGAW